MHQRRRRRKYSLVEVMGGDHDSRRYYSDGRYKLTRGLERSSQGNYDRGRPEREAGGATYALQVGPEPAPCGHAVEFPPAVNGPWQRNGGV